MRSTAYLRKIIRESIKSVVKNEGEKVSVAIDEKQGKKKDGLKDACWSGYEAYGMKTKNGRRVPNCVPKSESVLRDIIESLKEASCDECGMNEEDCGCGN